MALLVLGVHFFQQGRLLGVQLDAFSGTLLLQGQPAVVAAAQAVLVEDVLDGGGAQAAAFGYQ